MNPIPRLPSYNVPFVLEKLYPCLPHLSPLIASDAVQQSHKQNQQPKNSTGTPGSSPNSGIVKKQKSKRGPYVKKSCENCRKYHARCEGDDQRCSRCKELGLACCRRPSRETKKRKPCWKPKDVEAFGSVYPAGAESEQTKKVIYDGYLTMYIPHLAATTYVFPFSCESVSQFFMNSVRPQFPLSGNELFTVTAGAYQNQNVSEKQAIESLDWAALSIVFGGKTDMLDKTIHVTIIKSEC